MSKRFVWSGCAALVICLWLAFHIQGCVAVNQATADARVDSVGRALGALIHERDDSLKVVSARAAEYSRMVAGYNATASRARAKADTTARTVETAVSVGTAAMNDTSKDSAVVRQAAALPVALAALNDAGAAIGVLRASLDTADRVIVAANRVIQADSGVFKVDLAALKTSQSETAAVKDQVTALKRASLWGKVKVGAIVGIVVAAIVR